MKHALCGALTSARTASQDWLLTITRRAGKSPIVETGPLSRPASQFGCASGLDVQDSSPLIADRGRKRQICSGRAFSASSMSRGSGASFFRRGADETFRPARHTVLSRDPAWYRGVDVTPVGAMPTSATDEGWVSCSRVARPISARHNSPSLTSLGKNAMARRIEPRPVTSPESERTSVREFVLPFVPPLLPDELAGICIDAISSSASRSATSTANPCGQPA